MTKEESEGADELLAEVEDLFTEALRRDPDYYKAEGWLPREDTHDDEAERMVTRTAGRRRGNGVTMVERLRVSLSPRALELVKAKAEEFAPIPRGRLIEAMVRQALADGFVPTSDVLTMHGARIKQVNLHVSTGAWLDDEGCEYLNYTALKEKTSLIAALLNLWVAGEVEIKPLQVTIKRRS